MRKILLGTTALIGAVALTAGASAAAPELSISGNYDVHIVGNEEQARGIGPGDTPNAAVDTGKGGRDNKYRFDSADSISEIRFRANGENDTGVKYGAVIDYRYLANSTDEAYLYIEGTFGRFHLGQDDGAVDHRMIGADSIAPGGYLINGWEVFLAPEANGTGDENKVVYFTPGVNGVNAAISLTDGNGIFDDIAEVGVSYGNSLFGVDYAFSAGYILGSASGVSSVAATPTVNNVVLSPEDLTEWNVGWLFRYGPFAVAGSYGDEGDSGTYSAVGVNSNTDRQNLNGRKTEGRKHYNIGFAYEVGGGINAGISYGQAQQSAFTTNGSTVANDTVATTATYTNGFSAEETQSLLTFDVGFPLLNGVDGYAGVAFSEWERDGRSATGNNAISVVSRDATTYVVGTTISF